MLNEDEDTVQLSQATTNPRPDFNTNKCDKKNTSCKKRYLMCMDSRGGGLKFYLSTDSTLLIHHCFLSNAANVECKTCAHYCCNKVRVVSCECSAVCHYCGPISCYSCDLHPLFSSLLLFLCCHSCLQVGSVIALKFR